MTIGLKANYSFRDTSGDPVKMDNVKELGLYDSIFDEEGNPVIYPTGETGLMHPFHNMNTSDKEHFNALGTILNAKVTVPWVKGLSYEAFFSNDLRWHQHNYF